MVKTRYYLLAMAGGIGGFLFLLPAKIPVLAFDQSSTNEISQFKWSTPSDPYLTKLRVDYKLDDVIAGKTNDFEKIQAICHWVHGRWKHDGSNQPEKSDAISILQKAAEGKCFRCVEYSIVTSAALNAVGIPARSLDLMRKDVETCWFSAGHVVTEAYLRERNKWMMVPSGATAVCITAGGKR
jgi:transglutaminase-like putative cysteine protease